MKQILDIGCGTGFRTSRLMSHSGTKVTGIDISRKNIIKAKKLYPNISFKQMSAEKIKFPDKYFDEIYAHDVLEHIDNIKIAINEITRVLKVGGRFFATVPGEKSERWLAQIRPTFSKEIHHVRIFKNGQLEDILGKRGLSLVKCKPKNFLQHIELYYFFKTQNASNSQLEIGSWRDNWRSIIVHSMVSMFDPFMVFNTPLVLIPLWIITLPVGFILNFFGNKIMPKSIYYEFVKC